MPAQAKDWAVILSLPTIVAVTSAMVATEGWARNIAKQEVALHAAAPGHAEMRKDLRELNERLRRIEAAITRLEVLLEKED